MSDAQSNPELGVTKNLLERQQHELEILKALHAAALERWKDRRENEWKLNYAIWAAIAALDGVLLLHKDAFCLPVRWIVVGGVAAVVLHLAYLWPTIERAISEIEMQRDAELAMRVLIQDHHALETIKTTHLGGAIARYDHGPKWMKWLWKRYGLFAPVGLTVTLLVFGGYISLRSCSAKTTDPSKDLSQWKSSDKGLYTSDTFLTTGWSRETLDLLRLFPDKKITQGRRTCGQRAER